MTESFGEFITEYKIKSIKKSIIEAIDNGKKFVLFKFMIPKYIIDDLIDHGYKVLVGQIIYNEDIDDEPYYRGYDYHEFLERDKYACAVFLYSENLY